MDQEALQHRGKNLSVFISERDIQAKLRDMGREISEEYAQKNPLLLGVLNGSFMFFSDLVKHIVIPMEIDFLKMQSYEGTESTNDVKCLLGLKIDLTGRHVIIVDDILETGQTLQKVIATVQQLGAASVKICVLIDKVNKLKVPLKADFKGFDVIDKFVIGYGMDWDEWGRNLKQIYIAQ